jgi:hypothetical protein
VQGVDADDSDLEWDEYIRVQYGKIALEGTSTERDPGAAHVDVDDMLR